MLYVVSFPDGWFKLGFTYSNVWTRVCLFWTNKHPADLCGKLGPDDIKIEALFTGGHTEEQALFSEFQPQCGEFFHDTAQNLNAFLKMMRTRHEELPIPPRPKGMMSDVVEKLPCCGGVEYTCFECGAKFPRGIKLKQHLDDVHRKIRCKCACGKEVIQRNLKRHQSKCKV